jgi:hypothetical protein
LSGKTHTRQMRCCLASTSTLFLFMSSSLLDYSLSVSPVSKNLVCGTQQQVKLFYSNSTGYGPRFTDLRKLVVELLFCLLVGYVKRREENTSLFSGLNRYSKQGFI